MEAGAARLRLLAGLATALNRRSAAPSHLPFRGILGRIALPLSQTALAETESVATTAPTAHRREGCSHKVETKVYGQTTQGCA